jgi:adenylate kinase family enzyme
MAHISTSNLIKDALNNHEDKWFANRMKESLQSGDLVGDDFINQIMEERLNRIDCQTMGVCLEGYPRSENQNKHMQEVIKM